MKAVFLRLIESDHKGVALREAVRRRSQATAGARFEIDTDAFQVVPKSAFAYWIGPKVIDLFRTLDRLGDHAEAWVGLQTNDDFRWLRLDWENYTQDGLHGLVPFAKGGAYSCFYSPIHLAVRWGSSGRSIKEWKIEQLRLGRITANNSRCWNETHYFRPGITWPSRTQRFGPRALPAACIFGHKGPALFPRDGAALALLAIINSRIFGSLVETRLNAADRTARSYEVGVVRDTPFPGLNDGNVADLAKLARRSWSCKRRIDASNEVSRAFLHPALLQVKGDSLRSRAHAWGERIIESESEAAELQAQIDRRCFELYGVEGEERRQIEAGFPAASDDTRCEDDDQDAEPNGADLGPLVESLLSWSLGVAFGRFDVRLATHSQKPLREPEPFDPLPMCSAGMLTGDDGLPLEGPPPGYPIDFPLDGVLTDDPGHDRDRTARMRQAIELVFGEQADAVWQEAAEIMGVRTDDVRGWLAKSFFESHVKRYSKSRRKAPIYWQLSTPSASYSVWLYLHRLTRDTFYKVLNDFVEPKLRHEERKLASLTPEAGGSPTSSQRKQVDVQEHFVEELRSLRDEVARVAPLWNPNFDDGVIINFAPLWRLVPQHRSWQRECKKVWDKLCKGEYDWAHLAMHLWPERVVPKCHKDRSLAIAHGLEDVFWEEDSDGKWKSRRVDPATVDGLVEERTSAAVRDARRSLLDAPVPTSKGSRRKSTRSKKTRGNRAASAGDEA